MQFTVVCTASGAFILSASAGHAFTSPVLPAVLEQTSHASWSVRVLDERPPSLNQPPVADGIVDRYLLHPRGDVNGILLRDGSQMYVTSRAAQELVRIVQPGDHVRVHGRRVVDSPLVQADAIINVTDGVSFVVPYRLDLPPAPTEGRPTLNEMSATGAIHIFLYHPTKGVVNGVILSDGTQVRFPPDVGEHFPTSLEPQMDVDVKGYGTITHYGRALEANAIGRKGQQLTHLDASIQKLR